MNYYEEIRKVFEQRCQIDMARYRWHEGTQQYIHAYSSEPIRVVRINDMFQGFLSAVGI